MRYLLLAAAGVALLAGPAFAKDAKPPSCTAQWNAKSDTDKAATTRKAFMADCKESNAGAPAAPATTAMAPAASGKPPSCTAQWNSKSDADKAGTTRKAFMAGCKGGDTAAPAATPATAAMVPAKGAKAPSCTAQWNAKSDTDKAGTTRKAFMAGCKELNASGGTPAPTAMAPAKPAMVPAAPAKPAMTPTMAPAKPVVPAAPTAPSTMKAAAPTVVPTGAAPEGATGVCKDGTYTKSKGHSGACSHHGGVAKWL